MSAASQEACRALLHAHERDLWLTTLFAPVEKRAALCALYAFHYEIRRIADLVRDPLPGEIRLQWWREALAGEREGEMLAHPVAAGVRETIERHALPLQSFLDLIDARTFDLYHDPMPDRAQLEFYCGAIFGAVTRLACLILAVPGRDPGGAAACGHAGVALGIVEILRRYAWHFSRGRSFIPADILARKTAFAEMRTLAREHRALTMKALGALAPEARKILRPAILPLALTELYLRRMERRGFDPARSAVDVPQWRRQWALWRAAR